MNMSLSPLVLLLVLLLQVSRESDRNANCNVLSCLKANTIEKEKLLNVDIRFEQIERI